jgi:glyoxylase-like metal-dependent hydrolase (beta-lactamase superfamily II)
MTYMVDIGEYAKVALYIWYIQGPDLKILVDSGIKPADLHSRGRTVKPFRKGSQPDDDPITPALAELGITPADIDIVIQTQLHYDHCALAHLFTNAKFIVQRAELQAALYDPPITQKPLYKKDLIKDLEFLVVDGDAEVTDGVWVLHTPGHSPGGQSVLIDTMEGRAAISGLCTIQENFDPPEPYSEIWPVIPPGIHCDLEMSYRSLLKIKTISDIQIALHDFKWTGVKSVP